MRLKASKNAEKRREAPNTALRESCRFKARNQALGALICADPGMASRFVSKGFPGGARCGTLCVDS
eukprot:15458137-Alexandrium_andersonii.AAC.1